MGTPPGGNNPPIKEAKYHDPTAMELSKTLGQRLIPVADRIRDLHTQFGLRPYKLRIVRVRWATGERGRGLPVVEKEIDILPTPLVQDMSTMMEIVQPVGLDEVGTIIVSEISGRFTDDDLRFADSDGTPLGPDEEVFYEIEFPRTPDGLPGDKRRFFMRSAPMYFAARFQWQLRLEKTHPDRLRNGDYE